MYPADEYVHGERIEAAKRVDLARDTQRSCMAL